MTVHADALATNIALRLGACSHDELRVLDRVLAGLETGREVYGPMDIARDPRSFLNEAAQEARDLLVYLAAHEVAKWDARTEKLRAEAAVELSPIELGLRELCDAEPVTLPRERFDLSDGEL
jgi:hypothetical protein